jgi:Xaa-Pro aminopeptidase
MTVRPDFALHRRRLLDRLGADEAVLLFGAAHPLRNGDSEFKYRPDSDVYWLTGWEQADCAVFLRPGDAPFTMFVQPRDKERETWTGRRPGPEGARERYGADAAFPIEKVADELVRLVQGVRTLHYAFGRDHDHDLLVLSAIARGQKAARKTFLDTPDGFVAPARLLHDLRMIKGADEVAVMREAARITGEAHRAAMRDAHPGKNEREIEALIEWTFRREGGNGPGYGTIVAGGPNACILHYIENKDTLVDGDLLLIDAGCEYALYTGDVTRTFPVGGRFSAPQRRVYEHVLAAQEAAFGCARAGKPYRAMHDAAVRRLTEGMIDLGLLTGSVDERVADDAYRKYYMHGTGHWLGLDVHDAGAYVRGNTSRPLEPGLVVTVEPGLYIPPDDDDAPRELRGIGVRIEDDLLITDGEPDNLTRDIPKTVSDVEAICAR